MDLPSFQELSRQLKAGKALTLFFARDQRREILELERQLNRLARVVDDFYNRLGSRNWIFHDLLSVDKIESMLAETSDAEAAERRLIEIYRDEDVTKWWLTRLRAQDGFRQRSHQLERAKEHFAASQFDSCAFHLIAVMDGFVNDFEPGTRRGLASREAEDMTAWDSVVGHHLGLTHALNTFKTTIKKRIDDEVFDVYRHGIMHGSIVNFNNVVVATKAWNMLFAVADWAKATLKAAEPADAPPSWSSTWSTIQRQAAYRAYENEFEPWTITPRDVEFQGNAEARRASEFLEAWQYKRWGLVAAFAPPTLSPESKGHAARFARDTFQRYELNTWKLTSVTYDRASSVEIRAVGTVDNEETEIRFRMVRRTADGKVALPSEQASWSLAVWAPHTFFH